MEALVTDQPLLVLDGIALIGVGVAIMLSRPRMVSTTWEVALLGAAVGGLLVYFATVSHSWGHPIHWLAAGLAALMGYSVGLVAATPRYTMRRGSKASTPT